MATGFPNAANSAGLELTPLLGSVTREEALCQRTAPLKTLQSWLDVFYPDSSQEFYFLRQTNTTVLTKQNTKYEWAEGRGRSAFKLFLADIAKSDGKSSFREQQPSIRWSKQRDFQWARKETEWRFDHLTERKGWVALLLTRVRGTRGSGLLFMWKIGLTVKFSKVLQKHHQDQFACSEYLPPPPPKLQGRDPIFTQDFPTVLSPHTRPGEDQPTGNGKTSRGKHFSYNSAIFLGPYWLVSHSLEKASVSKNFLRHNSIQQIL